MGMTLQEKRDKYYELCHAMQTGVAMKMGYDSKDTTPKHLRVGINSALCDHGALISLLVSKGVITEDEYFDKLIEFMEREVKSYEAWLQKYYDNISPGGKGVTIHLL